MAVAPADLGTILTTIQESNSTCHVSAKLKDGCDYARWKREMTLYFRGSGLWPVISEEPPARPDAAWSRKNDKALLAIHNACVVQQQDLIIDVDIAKVTWERLRASHESRDPTRVQILWNTFHSISMENKESIADYTGRVKSAARQIQAAGETVSESQMVNRTIQGLPSSYGPLKSSLAVLDNLTKDSLTKILTREEAQLFLESSGKSTGRAPLDDITRRDGQDRKDRHRRSRSRSRSRGKNDTREKNRRRSRSRSRSLSHSLNKFCSSCKL